MFDRGYSKSRDRAKKGLKYIRSCFNCDWFFKSDSDSDEVCQNPNVSEYDLVIDDNNIFCTYWKQLSNKELQIENTGRNRKI